MVRGRSRQHTVNDNFFKNLDSESAYVLGYTIADGCITKNDFLKFECSEKQLIRDILDVMDSDYEIDIVRDYWRVRIKSARICHHLRKYDVKPNKSRSIKLPDLPDKFFPDFVRGYFDGDGSVFETNEYIQVRFCSASKDFIKDFRIKLNDISEVGLGGLSEKKDSLEVAYAHTDSLRLYNFIYEPDCLCSELKKERFEELIDDLGEAELKSFSSEEVQFLKENMDSMSLRQLTENLPERGYHTVKSKVYQLRD